MQSGEVRPYTRVHAATRRSNGVTAQERTLQRPREQVRVIAQVHEAPNAVFAL